MYNLCLLLSNGDTWHLRLLRSTVAYVLWRVYSVDPLPVLVSQLPGSRHNHGNIHLQMGTSPYSSEESQRDDERKDSREEAKAYGKIDYTTSAKYR